MAAKDRYVAWTVPVSGSLYDFAGLWFQCLFRSTLSPDFCTTGINHVGILVAMGERDPLLPDDKHYAFCGWCLRKRRKAILIPTVWMLANVDYEDLLTDFVGDFT